MFGAHNICRGPSQTQRVAVGADAHVQTVFERREILIELSEETDAIFQIAQIDGSL